MTAARSSTDHPSPDRPATDRPATDWASRLSPSLDELEQMAAEALAAMPAPFRALTGEVLLLVADFPEDEALDALDCESEFDLLGLFEGRGLGERDMPVTGEGPNRITLYRRPILDYWAEHEESLGHIVAHVLIHEIGHHFGLSDEDMERLEAAVA